MSVNYWKNPNNRISDYKFITGYLRENDVYIDVGANIGTTLIPAAKTIKGGKAIGFEPHPRIFSYLMENVSLNNLGDNIELYNCAVGSERGSINFSSGRADDCNKVLITRGGIKVPVKLLDDFVTKFSKIDLMKIDVEGYEKFVVEGGIKALAKTQCIYFEVSEEHFRDFGYSLKDLLNQLENMGFHLFLRKQAGVLEPINPAFELSDAFAIRNIDNFLSRTGWSIYDAGIDTKKPGRKTITSNVHAYH